MEESKRTIAILGGGYSGLSAAYYSAAYYLSRLGYQVTLFEKEAQVGGFSQGTQLGQVVYERVPHSFHRSDTSLLSLMTDLGMEQQLRWRPIRTAVILRDRAYGVHSVWSVLRLRPLRFLQRLVLLAGYTYLKYLSHPRKLERRPAALYTRRLFGRGVYRAIWEPILRSRFYLHMHAVNMAWFWANLKARSRRFYQGRQMLGYPIGGFHRVTEALVHRISHRGVRVCCGAEVGLLQKTDAGWLVQVNGQPHHFQQVLSTLPGATLARIL
ncbi:MAG: FAD-dependent oxidoreductase, partial [bacterium]